MSHLVFCILIFLGHIVRVLDKYGYSTAYTHASFRHNRAQFSCLICKPPNKIQILREKKAPTIYENKLLLIVTVFGVHSSKGVEILFTIHFITYKVEK